jgi:hypothetical protein
VPLSLVDLDQAASLQLSMCKKDSRVALAKLQWEISAPTLAQARPSISLVDETRRTPRIRPSPTQRFGATRNQFTAARQLSELLGFQANGCQKSLSAGAHGSVFQFEHGTIGSAARTMIAMVRQAQLSN